MHPSRNHPSVGRELALIAGLALLPAALFALAPAAMDPVRELLWLAGVAPLFVSAARGRGRIVSFIAGAELILMLITYAAFVGGDGGPAAAWRLAGVALTLAGIAFALWRLAERFDRDRALLGLRADGMTVIVDDNGTVRHASRSATADLGVEPADLIGKRLVDRIHPQDRERMLAAIDATAGGGPASELELRIAGEGRWIPVDLMARRPEPTRTDIARVVVDLRDAAERKRREGQSLMSHRMQAVGRLAGGAAHDFNNIFTALQGHAQLLVRELELDDPRRPDIDGIKKAAERASDLTQQLLAFSRQQILLPEVFALSATVDNLEPRIRRIAGSMVNVTLELEADGGWIRADPTQIEKALLHLVQNACEAMPTGGELRIRVADTAVTDEVARQYPYPVRPGAYVLCSVEDSGRGMDEEVQARIFEPFFTTKERGTGNGLGLSAVYGVVKQSEGYIWVTSRVGGGTRLAVYLPGVAKPEAGWLPATARIPGAGDAVTILVVEDDEMVRSLVRRILLQDGYIVLEAQNGQDAIWMAAGCRNRIELLLTDLYMPGMNGQELAQTIRAERPEVRVLYMSGFAEEAVMRPDVLESGAAFLPKPFTPERLSDAVRQVLYATAG